MNDTPTPTPRTDKWRHDQECNYEVTWEDNCEQLERELARSLRLAEDNGKLAHQTACELAEARDGWRLSSEQTERAWQQCDTLAEALMEAVLLTEEMSNGKNVGNRLIAAWDKADKALATLNP